MQDHRRHMSRPRAGGQNGARAARLHVGILASQASGHTCWRGYMRWPDCCLMDSGLFFPRLPPSFVYGSGTGVFCPGFWGPYCCPGANHSAASYQRPPISVSGFRQQPSSDNAPGPVRRQREAHHKRDWTVDVARMSAARLSPATVGQRAPCEARPSCPAPGGRTKVHVARTRWGRHP